MGESLQRGEGAVAVRHQRSLAGWSVWPWWALASALGAGVGFAAAVAVLSRLGAEASRALDEVVIFGLIGAGMGTAQWFVLRSYLGRAAWWAGATTLGWLLLGVAARVGGNALEPVMAYGGAGAVLGLFQWLVLRRGVGKAGWWLLASPVGWAAGIVLARAVDGWMVLPLPESAAISVLFGVASGVAGVATGGVLACLLQRQAV